MAKRTPERAAAVVDRAARMRRYKAGGVFDRLKADKQMKTAHHAAAPFDIRAMKYKPAGQASIDLRELQTLQNTVSANVVKRKIAAGANSNGQLPQVLRHEGRLYVTDGNHEVMRARALGERKITANIVELGHELPRGAAEQYRAAVARNVKMTKAGKIALAVGGAALIGQLLMNSARAATPDKASGPPPDKPPNKPPSEPTTMTQEAKAVNSPALRPAKQKTAQAPQSASRQSYIKVDGTPGKKDFTAKQIAAFKARQGQPRAA